MRHCILLHGLVCVTKNVTQMRLVVVFVLTVLESGLCWRLDYKDMAGCLLNKGWITAITK